MTRPAMQEGKAKIRPSRIEPRGLGRIDAAAYVGIGTSKFDELVVDGRMPKPRVIDSRRVWDRRELDDAFEDLPTSDARTGWENAHGED